jgi:hypothetical protein
LLLCCLTTTARWRAVVEVATGKADHYFKC